jgi:hypothetical protein
MTTTRARNRRGFEHSEGLRALLTRLHEQGRGAWRADPEVTALMRHAAERYAALAKKHGLDPWAMVAHAVQDFPSPTRVSTSPTPETTYDPAPRRPSAPPARPSHSGAIKKVTRAGLGGASTAAGNRCPGWRSSAVGQPDEGN